MIQLERPGTISSTSRVTPARPAHLALWLGALLLGALHAWSGRHDINIDGVSYLDLGDALVRGDWANAINAHWSPLYALLLGLTMAIVGPTPYWEYTAAHLLNFGIYAAVLAAFDYLLREVIRHQRWLSAGERTIALPPWAWFGIGYLLFVWASLQFITLWVLTPDLLVMGIVFLSTALLLSIRRGAVSATRVALLGAVLAVGYLAKAPVFPLAFLFFVLAVLAIGNLRRAMPKAGVALVVFLVISGPFILALSASKGRATFGDSRTLAFAWFVNQAPIRHWQGGYPAEGEALHPSRRVFDAPAVYEFSEPVVGTYPVWYDPSYWYEGIRPRWDVSQVLATLMTNGRQLQDMFLSYVQVSLVLTCAAMVMLSGAARSFARGLLDQWPILVPAAAGLGLYSAVSVFPRYVAPFLVLLWVGVLAAVQLPEEARSRRILAASAALLVLVLTLVLSRELGPTAMDGARAWLKGEQPADHPHWEIAEALGRLGIGVGDKVAIMHPEPRFASFSGMIGWARLARVRIVAEIQPDDSAAFWAAHESVQGQVLRTFARAGATLVVTKNIPLASPHTGWQRVGVTEYFARVLPLSENRSTVSPPAVR